MLIPSIVLTVAAVTLEQVTPVPPQAPPQAVSNDIVVTGLRDIDDKDSAVTTQTLGSMRTGSAVRSRAVFGHAQAWARCAANPADPKRREYLRQIFNARVNSTKQAFAYQRLARLTVGCTPDPQKALRGGIISGNSYYDSGALTIEVMKYVTPRPALTRKQTSDPTVQSRFNLREVPLSEFRLPVDMKYFQTAVCFVRLQPELSVQLSRTESLDGQRRLEAAIVNRAKVCVGNARSVYFDGVQFRFYIADAVYRWILAARGVDTLLPD